SAQHVVRGLLTFARRVPLERTPVDLAELVDKVLALMAGDLRLAGVEVLTALEPHSPPVCADRNQLQQVLVNLIVNAKHALAEVVPGERRLRISLQRAGLDGVRLQVEDNGPGIPADLITKVFDPFVTTKTEGTGLGLSISYGIVREHDLEPRPHQLHGSSLSPFTPRPFPPRSRSRHHTRQPQRRPSSDSHAARVSAIDMRRVPGIIVPLRP